MSVDQDRLEEFMKASLSNARVHVDGLRDALDDLRGLRDFALQMGQPAQTGIGLGFYTPGYGHFLLTLIGEVSLRLTELTHEVDIMLYGEPVTETREEDLLPGEEEERSAIAAERTPHQVYTRGDLEKIESATLNRKLKELTGTGRRLGTPEAKRERLIDAILEAQGVTESSTESGETEA